MNSVDKRKPAEAGPEFLLRGIYFIDGRLGFNFANDAKIETIDMGIPK